MSDKVQVTKDKRFDVRFMPRAHALRFLKKALVKHRRLLELLKDK
jgi:hypothetical protein